MAITIGCKQASRHVRDGDLTRLVKNKLNKPLQAVGILEDNVHSETERLSEV